MVHSRVPCTQVICLEEMAGYNVGAESTKEIFEEEKKPFTSSLNIYLEACCR
jgi:hypothetical protein